MIESKLTERSSRGVWKLMEVCVYVYESEVNMYGYDKWEGRSIVLKRGKNRGGYMGEERERGV